MQDRIDLEIDNYGEIDMAKENTAVSTSYNNVKVNELAPRASRDILVFIKNTDGVCGSIIKLDRFKYRDLIKKSVDDDLTCLNKRIEELHEEGCIDGRIAILKSAERNILGSDLYELAQEGGEYKEYKIVNLENLLEE